MKLYGNEMYVTVDMVIVAVVDEKPWLLLVRRANDSSAFPGLYATPGGYVENDETSEEAGRRELAEETGLTFEEELTLIDVYDAPDRDPRGRVMSVAYLGVMTVDVLPEVHGADDVSEARWVPLSRAGEMVLAFDHSQIVSDAARCL